MFSAKLPGPPRLVLLAVALAGAVLLSSCASGGISLFDLEPAEGDAATAGVLDGKVTLRARYLDAGERVDHLRAQGYEALGLGLRQVSMVAFVLDVRNDSGRDLTLDPAGIRLAVGFGPLLSPYNYAHLYMELPRRRDRQRILEDLKEAVFDKSTTLRPGSEQSRLLLFPRPEKVGPEVALLFNRLYVGNEETQAVMTFRSIDLEN